MSRVIPESLTSRLSEQDVRKEMIDRFGGVKDVFAGTNAFGDRVTMVFDSVKGIKMTTYQANGWIRINFYDANGLASGETYEGRWR